jgi:hypothetical protein
LFKAPHRRAENLSTNSHQTIRKQALSEVFMLDSCGFVDRFCSSATSDISHRQDFTRSLPVTVAADPTRRIQELQIKV